MKQEQIPVLIIGAGGAGLSLSLFLKQQNISSLLIERRADISWYPRARNLNFRTLEVFRGLGIEEEVVAASSHVTKMYRKETLAASEQEELLDPNTLIEHIERISPEPVIRYCPQSVLEPLLREEARKRGAEVRYGTELLSFTQDEEGVTATIRDRASGEVSEVRAQYMIAADGAHSHVRRTLAIPTRGVGELPEHYIFVYFKANWGELVQNYLADAIMISNEAGHGMFLVTNLDRGMFVITDTGSGREYTPEYCREQILAAMGTPNMNVEVMDMARWQPIQRVAERFSEGRIFLVGDAAHTMPPKLGLGVNTAIQSANNLAWKLAAVLQGQAPATLLETYKVEREPVGWLAAEQSFTGPAAALVEKDFYGEDRPAPLQQLPLLQIMIGYRYHSNAVLVESEATPSPDEIELIDPETGLNGQPGTRVPHLWLERGSEQGGQRISTLNLLDGRFVLLTGPDGAAWYEDASGVATDLELNLAAHRIGAEGALRDMENEWETKMGVSREGAVLVRPDGFVAWRTSTRPDDAGQVLKEVLAAVLCRTTAASHLMNLNNQKG